MARVGITKKRKRQSTRRQAKKLESARAQIAILDALDAILETISQEQRGSPATPLRAARGIG